MEASAPQSAFDSQAPHDALGIIVPAHLEEIFRGRDMLWRLVHKVEMLQRQFQALADEEFCSEMDSQAVVQTFHRLRALIRNGLPFTLCDCQPYGECPLCKGKKWISGTQYLQTSRPGLTSV